MSLAGSGGCSSCNSTSTTRADAGEDSATGKEDSGKHDAGKGDSGKKADASSHDASDHDTGVDAPLCNKLLPAGFT